MHRFLIAALAVPLIALGLHQVVPGMPIPDPTSLRPFGIGPYDHAKPLEFFGLTGQSAALGIAGALLVAMGLFAVTGVAGARLSSFEWTAFGILAGGVLSNVGELLVRGAAMDWLWISFDGRTAIIANSADVALVGGAFLIALRAGGEGLSYLRARSTD